MATREMGLDTGAFTLELQTEGRWMSPSGCGPTEAEFGVIPAPAHMWEAVFGRKTWVVMI